MALVLMAIVAFAVIVPWASTANAQDSPLEPLDSSSPQATYISFVDQLQLLEELLREYEANRTEATQRAFAAAIGEVEDLFDLSEVSAANLEEVRVVSFASLADILNRIPPPDVDEIPDVDDVDEAATSELVVPGSDSPILASGGIASYTLPGTEITITRIEEGSRTGAYVFSADTVRRLPGWREEVDDLPVRAGVEVADWVQVEADFTGHLVPRGLVDALPKAFDSTVLGTQLWKLIFDVIVAVAVGFVSWIWYRAVGRRGTPGAISGHLFRLTTPILVIVLAVGARRFMNEQVNHSGDVATIANLVASFVTWAALAWAFWIVAKLFVEWFISSPAVGEDGIDAHLVRLLGKVVAVGGVVVVGLVGLTRLGVPTVGLGVGAGVLGLAVGLAATGTLENLIGGITIYADRPFAVDDDVRVDGDFGTVAEIGPRSTSIRKLDDTKVVLPNADVSRLKITNFSERRHIRFLHVVGVRYESSVDQLRTIVNDIDTRFRDHPLVLDQHDYPRVRVVGFGDSSIDIEVRARIATSHFAEFQRVQQELLLLIYQIVDAAGSGFAFPSSTTYLAQDSGLSATQADALPRVSEHDSPATTAPVPAGPSVDTADDQPDDAGG